jgi:hypothetical protein
VTAGKRPISYPEERALENTAFSRGLVPTRIFAILLPVWCVTIRATVTDGEPYALIDQYLERGIATAGLDTAADLAGFFGLDEIVVDRAVRFLAAIGHLTMENGRLALTPVGQRSVRDKVRYVVTRQDRRRLYFDAFGSRPLTRRYYDPATVTFLSGATLQAASRDWPRFSILHSSRGFRREALAELASNRERARFNLPERIDEPESLGEEIVYLPLYIIRAVQRDGRVRYLAYSQVQDEADPDVTALCEATPEIMSLLETEERAAGAGSEPARARQWLESRNLAGHPLARLDTGMWRATLPGPSYDPGGPLSISKLGSFVVLASDFFQAWCDDEQVRRRALLERVDAWLSPRTRPDRAAAEELIAQIARQLELGELNVSALCQLAAKAGKTGLAAQLESLPAP